jgi:NADPH-dependent 2,4-dienoyl-CoA reductase/sulfur reductase-like enzyme
VPLKDFIEYGKWFQAQIAPDVDRRRVTIVNISDNGFRLTLDDGERLDVARVVVAAGIEPFAWCPEPFAGLPSGLVSHSSTLRDVNAFAGRHVLVLGAGQSALEDAALLHESGADVEIVARTPRLRWLRSGSQSGGVLQRGLRAVLYTPTEVGPPGLNWIAATPDVFHRLPGAIQPSLAVRCIGPVGASWLRSRLEGVTVTTGHSVSSVGCDSGRVVVTLDDGTRREADHALMATGYRVDIRRYTFMGPDLLRNLSMTNGYPRLSTGLEASIRGLHFIGAPASFSFGPVVRFVTGSWYVARALTRHVIGKPPLPITFSW